MSEIKWAYDSQTGSFSALPASPWLLPTLGLLCLAPLVAKIVEEAEKAPEPLPADFDPALFAEYRATYRDLMGKKTAGLQLTSEESLRLQIIEHPPWAKPGETWSY